MQQNKQPRSDEHQTKRPEIGCDWERCWVVDANHIAAEGNGSEVSGSARAKCGCGVCKGGEKNTTFWER